MQEILKHSLNKTKISSVSAAEKILNRKIKKNISPIQLESIWNASAYDLDKVDYYNSLNEEAKTSILKDAAFDRLMEAYYIENAGMTFTAKMSLLAESQHEQILYSMFASEEARHLSFIKEILNGAEENAKAGPFIDLLKQVIASGSRQSSIFIIQVLLEGWGIDHYGLMAKNTQNRIVKDFLNQILIDEANHHNTGIALFNEKELTRSENDFIVTIMKEFLSMVAIGPSSLMDNLEKNSAGLTTNQKTQG